MKRWRWVWNWDEMYKKSYIYDGFTLTVVYLAKDDDEKSWHRPQKVSVFPSDSSTVT